jgi:hypothetical protein
MRNQRVASRGYLCRAGQSLLAGILIGAGTLFAQQMPETPQVIQTPALDASVVGYQGIAIDPEVVGIALEPLNYEIDLWQKFIAQAQEQLDAVKNSPNPDNQALAARLTSAIAAAESHVAALQTTKKLRQDAIHCGLEEVYADWQELKKFTQEERERIGPAAAMAEQVYNRSAAAFKKIGGGAGSALIGASREIMEQRLERDDELLKVAESNLYIIDLACADAKRQKDVETYFKNLEKANETAKRALDEADTLAANGNFKDAPEIAIRMEIAGEVSRANQLTGNVVPGNKQWQRMIGVAKKYTEQVAKTCNEQRAELGTVLSLSRSNQLLAASDVDMDHCLFRLFEASGVAGPLPYRLRHCGKELNGTWHMQVTRGQIAGATGKLEGEAQVPGFTKTYEAEGQLPSRSATIRETEPVEIEAVGALRDRATKEPKMRVKGTIQVSVESNPWKHGIVVQDWKMRPKLDLAGFAAMPAMGGLPTYHPGVAGSEYEIPITVVNGGKPCDPAKDVWSYPDGP